MTTLARPADTTSRRGTLLTTTRVLLVLFGTLKLASTTYFLLFASAEAGGDPQGIFDWTVGVWSYVMGLSYVLIALRLGHDRRILPLAVVLSGADLAFSAVKIGVYHESAGIPFAVVTLVLLALLVVSTRPRRP